MHNMKLNQCIYCNSNDDLTVEHIIPSSISKKVGEQLVIFCVCRKCNSKLGDYVDGPFINDTMINLHRIIYDLKGKKNKIPCIKFKLRNKTVILNENLSVKVNGILFSSLYNRTNKFSKKADLIRAYTSRSNTGINLLVKSEKPLTVFIDYKVDTARFKLFALKVAYEVIFKNLEEYIDENDELLSEIRGILTKSIEGEFSKECIDTDLVGPLFFEFSYIVKISDLLQKHIVYTLIKNNGQVVVNICLFGLGALSFSVIVLEKYKGKSNEYIDLISYGDSCLESILNSTSS